MSGSQFHQPTASGSEVGNLFNEWQSLSGKKAPPRGVGAFRHVLLHLILLFVGALYVQCNWCIAIAAVQPSWSMDNGGPGACIHLDSAILYDIII